MAQESQQPASKLHVREAHAAIMTSTFVVLMPLGAMLVYLPAGAKTTPYIHAPFQIFTVCLAIAGLVLGVLLCGPDEYTGYHPIIGYMIVGLIVLVQPSLGLWQHLLFQRTGKENIVGSTHRWLGRCIIILGMVNGGLGFKFAGPVGSDNVPRLGVVVYSTVTGLVGLFYTAFVIWQTTKTGGEDSAEMKERYSYDSGHPLNRHHDDFTGGHSHHFLEGQGFTNGHNHTPNQAVNSRNNSSKVAPAYDRVT